MREMLNAIDDELTIGNNALGVMAAVYRETISPFATTPLVVKLFDPNENKYVIN